jgi:hypothetical protein
VATRVRMIGGKRRKRLEFGWHGPGDFCRWVHSGHLLTP